MQVRGRIFGLVVAFATVTTSALAQGVVSPDTKPSSQDVGAKDAKQSSVRDGSATVMSRTMSNGQTIPDAGKNDPAEAGPAASPTKP